MGADVLGARIALCGNPNAGKTTLFNQLTGASARVGNYPGITVERRQGRWEVGERSLQVVDLPGIYSLCARSQEEQIALWALLGELGPGPDCIVALVDASALDRGLYLVGQLRQLGLPLVVALNMMDTLEDAGLSIDVAQLQKKLSVPVVAMQARDGVGLEALSTAVAAALKTVPPEAPAEPLPAWLEEPMDAVRGALPESWSRGRADRARFLALWALQSVEPGDELVGLPAPLRSAATSAQSGLEAAGRDWDLAIAKARYRAIDDLVGEVVVRGPAPRRAYRADRWLTHPVVGPLFFVVLMGALFQGLFAWSDPAIGLVEGLFEWLGGVVGQGFEAAVEAAGPGGLADAIGLLGELTVDGIIAGVGGVLVFLPQILLLFLFLALMEASGYMARVVYLMDRLMRSVGLHGRAFVPLLSGFACAIPAVMATRTMERRRDRLLTMMVVPLMSCSARLPVYGLVIATMIPSGLVLGFLPARAAAMLGIYLFSSAMALVAAWVLSRTLLKGPRVPLLTELPPYRLPRGIDVLREMWRRGRLFVKEAGTVILACTVVLWALLSFPRGGTLSQDYDTLIAEAESAEIAEQWADEEAGERLRGSYAGRLGHAIEPAIAPLGFDWKIGIGLIGAFAAREVFVSTMGVVYGVGEGGDEHPRLREALAAEQKPDGSRRYTPLVGVSLMVFIALACQCMSTLAVIKRETRGYRWPAFVFVYMTALAWLMSLLVYQGGQLLGFS